MRRALIESSTGKMVNVIEIEADSIWQPPEGCELLDEANSQQASPGDTWDGTNFIPAPEPIPEAPIRFITYTHGLPDRITHIEEFLKMLYP